MPYTEHGTGRPGDNCAWEIRAAAYDFSQQIVREWFLNNIIKPVMVHGDGVWLDGDGPDNGGASRPRANERDELPLARMGAYLFFARNFLTPATPSTPPPTPTPF